MAGFYPSVLKQLPEVLRYFFEKKQQGNPPTVVYILKGENKIK